MREVGGGRMTDVIVSHFEHHTATSQFAEVEPT